MSEDWNTDENYQSYVRFVRPLGVLPATRDEWVKFNRAMDSQAPLQQGEQG